MATYGDVKAAVATRLNDPSLVTYPNADVLAAANLGVKAIVNLRPDAATVTQALSLMSGTRQTLPTSSPQGHRVLKVVRNTGGTAVRRVGWEHKDQFDPDWHEATAAAVVKEWLFDDRDPRAFYVSPPNDGNGSLEVTFSVLPADMSADQDPTGLHDAYLPALHEFILYVLWGADKETSPNYGRGQAALAAFAQMIGAKSAADLQISPKQPMARE